MNGEVLGRKRRQVNVAVLAKTCWVLAQQAQHAHSHAQHATRERMVVQFLWRKWRQLDIVVADNEEAAERRFFDRWTAKRRALNEEQSGVNRGGPPPTRDIPGQPFSKPPSSDIIGLFPQPGVPR